MKSQNNPEYAVIYSYQEEGVGGPGGCNPTWTEWEVMTFNTFAEMEAWLLAHPNTKNRDNFTIMGKL